MNKRKRPKRIIAPPVKSLKIQEMMYRKQLNRLGKMLIKAVREDVLSFIKTHEAEYVADGIGAQLGTIFENLNAKFTGPLVSGFAQVTSSEMVEKIFRSNKRKFDNSIYRALGVDATAIISNEGLEDLLTLSKKDGVILIKSLPQEYLKEVEIIVNNGVKTGARYSEIAKQISARVPGSSNRKLANRIKTIARNEVSTINSQINLRRSEALGIEKAIWRTSEDERVRGNPSGKYPKAIPSHFKLNGKEFDLKKGMKTETGEYIWPGGPINCRCSYSPIIEWDKISGQ